MIKRVFFALLLSVAALPAFADFQHVARHLRTQLGRPTTIPFLGLARLATWIIHPHGVRDFQLAVWERNRATIDLGGADVENLLRRDLARDFQPVVRVRSNRSNEWVFIYAAARAERFEILVLVHDRSDTVLVRADVDGERLARTIADPKSLVHFNVERKVERHVERNIERRRKAEVDVVAKATN